MAYIGGMVRKNGGRLEKESLAFPWLGYCGVRKIVFLAFLGDVFTLFVWLLWL